MLHKKLVQVVIVVAASLLFCFLQSPLFESFDYDRELFRYMGMALAKGQVPYLDFF